MSKRFQPKLLTVSLIALLTIGNEAVALPSDKDSHSGLPNNTARALLKLSAIVPASDFSKIANARSLGLPDNASLKQIEDAAWLKYANNQAKLYCWPANLTKAELSKLDTKRKRDELCRSSNLPDTASDKQIEEAAESIKQKQQKLLTEEQEIQNKHLSASLESEAYEKVLFKQKELDRPGAARLVGLPPTASWEQIKTKQQENSNQLIARKYGIKADIKPVEMKLAIEKQLSQEKINMARRILKASPKLSDVDINAQLQTLAKALGYPKDPAIHTEFDSLLTADELFMKVLPPKNIAAN